MEPSNFPLPTLGPKLLALSHDVHSGKGFCVIRGLNPAAYTVEDLTLVYLGVQSYIAEQRGRQDKRGNMLGEWLMEPTHKPTLTAGTVHIIADNSTKQAAEHHRHSTKAIVSLHPRARSLLCDWRLTVFGH